MYTMHLSLLSMEPDFRGKHVVEQFFGPILKALHVDLPKKDVKRNKIARHLSLFREVDGVLFYQGTICVPRSS